MRGRRKSAVAAGISGLLLSIASSVAYADATLDKIKQRNKVVAGVMLSGGPFGSIDPATQKPVGWGVELAPRIDQVPGRPL